MKKIEITKKITIEFTEKELRAIMDVLQKALRSKMLSLPAGTKQIVKGLLFHLERWVGSEEEE